jgi:hypothetical protein
MLRSAGAFVALIALAKFAIHLYSGGSYGFFVDELYYLACGEHLAWGYVDQPPLIAFVAKLARAIFGESILAIRMPVLFAGVGKVLLTGWLARELGGGRWAQCLAALCVLVAPGFLAVDHFLSMNAFEPLFWIGCAILLLRISRTGNESLWLGFGALAGLGLLNKHSMLIFGFGLVVGIILTQQRRMLRSKWPWIGLLIAFAIFSPNLIWNIQQGFPFLEIQANIARDGRNVDLSPIQFFAEELFAMHPLTGPIWIAGLVFLFRRFRVLAWAWVVTAAVIVVLNPRIYYLFPAFPILFAAGGVACESFLERHARLGWAYAALMLLTGAILSPLVLPILNPETYIRYNRAIHIEQPRIEHTALQEMPQLFADEFGWESMVQVVAAAYHRLPPEEQTRTAIFGQNYGQAGAVDFYGPRYALPHAISGHQNYFLWGPRGYTGESVIVLGDRREVLESKCDEVTLVGRVENPYSTLENQFDVFHCRGLRPSFQELWPQLKRWR